MSHANSTVCVLPASLVLGSQTKKNNDWVRERRRRVCDVPRKQVESVLVVRRKDNGKLACIGGFVEVGETLEEATRREVKEETGLEVTSLQMLPRVSEKAKKHRKAWAHRLNPCTVPFDRVCHLSEPTVF